MPLHLYPAVFPVKDGRAEFSGSARVKEFAQDEVVGKLPKCNSHDGRKGTR